jgi:ABC-type multidrug transport system ATPase subunit
MSIDLRARPRAEGAFVVHPPAPDDRDRGAANSGLAIHVDHVSRHIAVRGKGRITVLDDVSFAIDPGKLVAIVGPSGAGKTMALETIAGVARATDGSVRYDGVDLHANLRTFRGLIGYVPQDDIIHADLSLRQTLRFAARLRLPSSTGSSEVDDAVGAAIAVVGLTEQAEVRVGSLSGGQRKRASIAVELLTRPRVFFLDEPTSSLDPAASGQLMAHLRELAGRSTTVVFTTHSIDDLASCDLVVFMARGGRVAFVGTVEEALLSFKAQSLQDIYARLADDRESRPVEHSSTPPAAAGPPGIQIARRPVAGAMTQWRVLTRRTLETFMRNPLTLAILLGSPVLVVGMFAVLFRPGAFAFSNPSPSSMVMIGFWVVFAAFFFGITYGLLQICTERTIVHRERLVGLRLGAYVMSKVTVLVPFLLVVIVAMLGVLRLLNRLPARPLATYASMAMTLLLCSIAALAIGLLTSAGVRTVAQATLALPMLCFPAVLFAGAVLPAHLMAKAGAAFSALMPSRWAFDAIGHDIGARRILAHGGSRLGPPLLASFGNVGRSATPTYWLILGAFIVALLAATCGVLVRVSGKATR